MQGCTGLDGHPLEGLIDGVVGRPSLDDAVGHAIGFCLGDLVVWMDEVHHGKGGGFERGGIEAPRFELVEEIVIHAPIFQRLEVAVKSRTRISADVMDVDVAARPGEQGGGGQAREPGSHHGDGTLAFHDRTSARRV